MCMRYSHCANVTNTLQVIIAWKDCTDVVACKKCLHKATWALAAKAEWFTTQVLSKVKNLLTLLPFPFTGIRFCISWVVKISHIHLGWNTIYSFKIVTMNFFLFECEMDYSDLTSKLHCNAYPFPVQQQCRKRIMVLNNTLQNKTFSWGVFSSQKSLKTGVRKISLPSYQPL